jgi:hypothetical protein
VQDSSAPFRIGSAAYVAALFFLSSAVESKAGSLCPIFGNPVALANGQCQDAGGFSGAALNSQALSSLSQTSTQENAQSVLNKLQDRREQEAARCPEGFDRVNGSCERRAQPVAASSVPAPAPEKPIQVASRNLGPRKPKTVARPASTRSKRHETTATRRLHALPAREAEVEQPAGPRPTPQVAAPTLVVAAPTPVPRAGVLFGSPVPIQPDARFGSWIQGYGDYERRNATGGAYVNPAAAPGLPPFVPVQISAVSQTTGYGFQLGADVTTRGLFAPDDGLITGVMGGFSRSELTLNSTTTSANFALVDNSFSHTDATFSGGMIGVYGTYFRGPLSVDLILKTDLFSVSETFASTIAFAPNGLLSFPETPPLLVYGPAARVFPWAGSGSASAVDFSILGDVNYRIPVAPNYWIEPTAGLQYTTTMYGGGAANLGLADGDQLRLQGGARFGANFGLGPALATLTVTGLAYDDVMINGGFIRSQAFQGSNLLLQSDLGQVRGRGIVALNLEYGSGLSSFIQGEVRGGSGLIGAGGKIGLRYRW